MQTPPTPPGVHALTTPVRAVAHGALEGFNLGFKLLDDRVAAFEILVEAVAFRDELLLPQPEALLLDLDLLGKALAKSLFLLLELGVVELTRAGFAELPRLHLLRAISFVMVLLGGVNQVEHVGSDQDGAELLEVAVILVLNLSNAPGVLSTLHGATVVSLNVLLRTNDRERHSIDQAPGVVEGGIIVFL
jgi:hypothetical protein